MDVRQKVALIMLLPVVLIAAGLAWCLLMLRAP